MKIANSALFAEFAYGATASLAQAEVDHSFSTVAEAPQGQSCPESPLLDTASEWNGWGAGQANLRFQSNPGFTASQVTRLRLKWAFGFPGDTLAFAQPTLVGGCVFAGSASGFVYSLDASTGCTYWKFHAEARVFRASVSVKEHRCRRWQFFGCAPQKLRSSSAAL